MPRKKKNQTAKQPAPMRWEFDPDIPTDDFFDGRNLDELWDCKKQWRTSCPRWNGDTS